MIDAAQIGSFIPDAVRIALRSPCAKSQRGVLIIQDTPFGPGVSAVGHNAQPKGFVCDGSARCRDAGSQLCEHAEQAAIYDLTAHRQFLPTGALHMLHVKVKYGEAVASGTPSCWQCSRAILATGLIERVWLIDSIHDAGGRQVFMLASWTADAFHAATLANCGLPVIR